MVGQLSTPSDFPGERKVTQPTQPNQSIFSIPDIFFTRLPASQVSPKVYSAFTSPRFISFFYISSTFCSYLWIRSTIDCALCKRWPSCSCWWQQCSNNNDGWFVVVMTRASMVMWIKSNFTCWSNKGWEGCLAFLGSRLMSALTDHTRRRRTRKRTQRDKTNKTFSNIARIVNAVPITLQGSQCKC